MARGLSPLSTAVLLWRIESSRTPREYQTPMRLSVYLKRRSLSPEAFADLVGLHPTTVYRLLAGSFPKRTTIKKVVAATNGEITAKDMIAGAEIQVARKSRRMKAAE